MIGITGSTIDKVDYIATLRLAEKNLPTRFLTMKISKASHPIICTTHIQFSLIESKNLVAYI